MVELAATAWSLNSSIDAQQIAEQGAIAESLGLHSFWLPEFHFHDTRGIPSPMMLLAAVSACTHRIRLGSTSYLLPIRHPLQAAEEVAVLDQLSGGRVILGVGRGNHDAMFRAFEIDARSKRKRFHNILNTMIRAWEGQPVTHLENGEPVMLAPRPVQQPHPPIWVAAFGPLAIKQAASLGLPYLASPMESLTRLIQNYAEHRAHAEAAGFPPSEVVPVMRTVFVSDDPHQLRTVKQQLTATMAPARGADDPADSSIVGTTAEVTDKIAGYVEQLGMTHLIARGRIAGMEAEAYVACLEKLADITKQLNRQS